MGRENSAEGFNSRGIVQLKNNPFWARASKSDKTGQSEGNDVRNALEMSRKGDVHGHASGGQGNPVEGWEHGWKSTFSAGWGSKAWRTPFGAQDGKLAGITAHSMFFWAQLLSSIRGLRISPVAWVSIQGITEEGQVEGNRLWAQEWGERCTTVAHGCRCLLWGTRRSWARNTSPIHGDKMEQK